MKKHLLRLLLEGYKQETLFRELESKGINLSEATIVHLSDISINILDIVLDIVGFPADNTSAYDLNYFINKANVRNEKLKIVDKEMFCRDLYTEKYFESSFVLSK
ncbi:MAG: hypothetical protein V4561_02800 [Bacteroidota bacterium]